MRIDIDFETYSRCDLKKHGTTRYFSDPSTGVICLVYSLDQRTYQVWKPEDDCPADLRSAVEAGAEVWAHNVFFERLAWAKLLVPVGFPAVEETQWRCSMALCAAFGLPASLKKACEAMGLAEQKDALGSKLVTMLCSPRGSGEFWSKPTDEEFALAYRWAEHFQKHHADEIDLGAHAKFLRRQFPEVYPNQTQAKIALAYACMDLYCIQDVRAMGGLIDALPEWPARELKVWQLDQKINLRGIPIDLTLVDAAIDCRNIWAERCDIRLREITGGEVESAGQTVKLLDWVNERGAGLPNMQKGIIQEWVGNIPLKPEVIEALNIRLSVNQTSVAKFSKIRNLACPVTSKCYETLAYHGGHTGRWAGRGAQFHNLPQGKVWNTLGKDVDKLEVQRTLLDLIRARDVDGLEALFGDPMDALSSAVRAVIHSDSPLYVCDFAGIEARVLAWMADQMDLCEFFVTGADIYVDMAASIYKKPADQIDKVERAVGKQAILGLGFGMGSEKFMGTVRDKVGLEISPEFAQDVVTAYRNKYRKIRNFWYATEDAAKAAMATDGATKHVLKTAWRREGFWLKCCLPSGRKFCYPKPNTKMVTKFGKLQPELRYSTTDPVTRQWGPVGTYSGKLVENLVQATGRDLLVDAMFRLEKAGYTIICTIHDEIVCQRLDRRGSIEEVEQLMKVVPQWAEGCPVDVEGFETDRYRK